MNVNKLIIVGAGGFGREVHQWLEDWINCNDGWLLSGFIDDTKSVHGSKVGYTPILSTIKDYVPAVNDYLVCAIAKPSDKKKVVTDLLSRGCRFFTLIHPRAIVGRNVVVGQGSVICPFTVLSADLWIGMFATINSMCTVGHDVRVGDFVTISGHCDITGGVKLEDEVFLGSGATVAPNVSVGLRSIVGTGSVVIRSVAPDLTVFGVPAKRISG
ncbi:acetyltransferase [Pseudomonas syringae]|uniref:acetyltransferase n=1 Tax=Pseudomonas syringae TaxID=317 RepID=UPI0013731FA6|nr:acetyltransferase [Pseudomonas syringae]MDU8432120.1 acetyltransferase [Pseudomonas syringae pv. actinidifoliorum]MDU8522466.1 acetyltransferase [Pseudomonas syringae pv. actinidifoliorum]MDU8529130.1 acetyltransferase [Pseudomonas syringae pv. actinidifoliorum]NAS99050.1 transferase [Pseudomonas syringae pv. actinidifoliorum]NAT24650.1 transferase [Pseudomonas syringae pv. actinidifoliorum]